MCLDVMQKTISCLSGLFFMNNTHVQFIIYTYNIYIYMCFVCVCMFTPRHIIINIVCTCEYIIIYFIYNVYYFKLENCLNKILYHGKTILLCDT